MNTPQTTLALAALGAAAFVALSAGSQAEAALYRHTCPQVVTQTVTGDLSSWRPTSVARRFQSARVNQRGNRFVLECHYGGGVKVSKQAPLNQTCEANGRGIDCRTQEVRSQPRVYKRASISVGMNQTADIDEGVVGRTDGADFRVGPQGLAALSRARFSAIMGSGTYDACSNVATNRRTMRNRALYPGARFCMRTASGRLSSVVVSQFGNGLSLTFRTWAN